MVVKAVGIPTQATGWSVYGHTGAVGLLRQLLAHPVQEQSDKLHHAYLFWGARQIGKSTLCKAFAQAILCTGEHERPCGTCRACRLMAKGSHPDFRLVQPTDKNGAVDRLDGTLRVEQATEIIRDAALRPAEGRYKVFLLQDFHNANDGFANKLLKTLEEPPPHVVLCLTALERNMLLPTIVSRCQAIELRPLERAAIAQALMSSWQVEAEQSELLARLANGCLGWAVQQVGHPEGLQERLKQLQTLWQLMVANRIERLAFAEQLAAHRSSQQLFGVLEVWSTWWRDLLLAQNGCIELCTNVDQQNELTRQMQRVPMAEIQRYLRTLKRIEGYLHHTVNTRLALDVLVLQMPALAL